MAAAGIRPEKLRTSDIKSRLLNVAQTSLYRLSIPALPDAVNSFVKQRGIVSSTQVDDISLLCTETSLPGSSLATHEVTNDYHGVTEKMAYRRIYDNTLDCTFYVDREYRVIELFDGWINYIVGEGSITGGFSREDFKTGTAHHRILYPKTYKKDIFVSKFERDHHSPKGSSTFMEYTFVDAFPTNIVSMPVSYDQSQILKCTVSFSYTRYVRERKGVSVAQTNPGPSTPAEENSLDAPNILGNRKSELEQLRAVAAINTLDRSRTPGLLDRVLSGRARSQAGRDVGQRIFDAF